jgi:uncharacterized protein YndB with AHSA1/START domain/DNA-binding transcriptional ArsR family regulator
MRARRDVYQAIADPTRRAIIKMIAEEPLDMKTLTEKFDMSQQAVSLHVKLLANCGLVRMEQRGRNRFCHAQLGKLEEVEEWVGQYRKYWRGKRDTPEALLEKLRKGRHGKQTNNMSNRELRVSQLLDAPVQLVWEVWTQPEQLVQWWWSDRSSTTINRMEVKPGGRFDYVLRGPGMEIESMSVFLEVERHRKIVYQHLTTPKFTTTVSFEARGRQTFLTWSVVFEVAEQFIVATEKHGSAEVLKQVVDRLAGYVAGGHRTR